MHRAIGTFLWALVGFAATAQPIYFDRLYDGPSATENMFNVLLHEDGYVFAMASQDVFEDTGAVVMIFTDSEGIETGRTVFAPGGRNFSAGKLLERSDSGYVYLNSITDTIDGSRDFHFLMYGANGNVLLDRQYAKEGDDICFWGIECSNGGFALCGQSGNSDGSPADIMLLRTDVEGNELWRKFYGGSNWEGGSDIVETGDQGFLLLGWTRSYGQGQRDFYLVKTDAQGNEQWHKAYGTSGEEIGDNIMKLSDGNYLLTGSGSNPSVTQSLGRIYKITSSGDVIWSKTYTYENNTGHNLHETVETLNGDLVSVGMTNLLSNSGYLIRTNSLGEVIWQREYDHSSHTDLFYGILATEDGGFLLSGQAVNEEVISQDVWLLKVDSVGCPYPNCTVGIEEEEKTVMVDVWPNPVVDVLNIEKTDFSASLEMTVFDLHGREILKQVQNDTRGVIDVTTWPSGIYVLQGSDEKGRSFSVKVVKE